MARRKSKVARKKHRNEILLAVVIVCVLIAVVSLFFWLRSNRDVAPDSATLCPVAGPKGQYVVLIDMTDPYPHVQKAALRQRIQTLAESEIPVGYLLSIFILGSDVKSHDKPVFEKCNPGLGEDRLKLASNEGRIKHRFYDEFVNPVRELIESLPASERANTSPVFEMIQLAAINGFNQHERLDRKELIIFSDMIPNTSDYSMYKAGQLDYKTFAASPYGQRAKADLKDATVRINLLKSNERSVKNVQTNRFSVFWEDYFEASGARVRGVDTVEGL